MQEMVYLKAIQKNAPMGVSVSGTTDQKTYLKKIRGASSPLAPPGSAYARAKVLHWAPHLLGPALHIDV